MACLEIRGRAYFGNLKRLNMQRICVVCGFCILYSLFKLDVLELSCHNYM